MITVRKSLALYEHLMKYTVDGATVGTLLFDDGGRLSWPGRKELEYQLAYVEPYDLSLEARVIDGLPKATAASIRFLARVATEAHKWHDSTLDLLWVSHMEYAAFAPPGEGPALDRIVAALVAIHDARDNDLMQNPLISKAAETFITGMNWIGLPMNQAGLEEIFDAAEPACLGLGLVEL